MNLKDILIYIVAILFMISFFYPFYIEYKIKIFFKNYLKDINKTSYYQSIKYLKNLHSKLSRNSQMFPIITNILWHYRVNNYIVYFTIFLGFAWYLIWGR